MRILERTQSASAARSAPGSPAFSRLRVLGVEIANASQQQAVDLIEGIVRGAAPSSKSIYIVNAHTLNLACESPAYRQLLNGGEVVFADGTGVRWAARLRGVRMQSNLVGTDLIPAL